MDESCYAYTGANEACNVCDGWENGLTKITGWHKLTDLSAMKEFVSTVGPVTACFTVYEDFYHHYAGGVYSYDATTAGNVIGGHCICIVGYDDSNSCWIAKNSWGTGWGENGYFRMSYGSCGLDAEMWAPEGIVDGAAGSRLELFARGSDHALWHVWQTAPNNGWSGWASMGGWIDSPVVACNADGRLEVFVIGSDHALWHVWQTAPNNGWSDWASMGGWIDRLAVGQNADGRIEVFLRGSDHALWHVWQTAPNNGWSDWASMGGWIDSPVVACNADGRLEVFVIGSDHALWHVWQTAPNNGWSDWASMGGWIDSPVVACNADGRLEVFVIGSDYALWHVWQTAPNNGWSDWATMGGWIDRLAVGQNADGRIEVFTAARTMRCGTCGRPLPNNGWSDWASMGGWIDSPVVTLNADGRLEVFVIGSDHVVARVADRPEQRVERLGVDGRVDRPHGGGNECCSGCDQTFNAGPSHGRSWVGGGPEQWGAKRRNAKAQHGDDRVGSAVPSPSQNRRRRRSGGHPHAGTHRDEPCNRRRKRHAPASNVGPSESRHQDAAPVDMDDNVGI